MSSIARAHVNIALAKYWGKADAALNLPAVPSLSAGIEDLWTEAEVEFSSTLTEDVLEIDGVAATHREQDRLSAFYDLLRERADTALRARVRSRNNFPKAAGLASSASAFAALALAGSAALGLDWSREALSALARRGSGSASRSLWGGYVEIGADGLDEGDSMSARQVAKSEHLPLEVAVVMASTAEKAVSSRRAMTESAQTSPYYRAWVDTAFDDLNAIRTALLDRDMARLGAETERNCLKMHACIMANEPPVLFWNETTAAAMHAVWAHRAEGGTAFFTIDAGPNVVVFYRADEAGALIPRLEALGSELRITRVGGEPSVSGRP